MFEIKTVLLGFEKDVKGGPTQADYHVFEEHQDPDETLTFLLTIGVSVVQINSDRGPTWESQSVKPGNDFVWLLVQNFDIHNVEIPNHQVHFHQVHFHQVHFHQVHFHPVHNHAVHCSEASHHSEHYLPVDNYPEHNLQVHLHQACGNQALNNPVRCNQAYNPSVRNYLEHTNPGAPEPGFLPFGAVPPGAPPPPCRCA
ncbi:hypothetical protein MRX96_034842 [Rhipicephalus microplus]